MRQMIREHPFFHPQGMLHVCRPGFVSWNVEPHLARSGLLGVAPFFDVTRELPRPVYYPPPVRAYPDVYTHQTLEPTSSERSFGLQMTWLRGAKQYKKLGCRQKSTNFGSRKRKFFSKTACTKRKAFKKGVSREDAPTPNAVQEKDVATSTVEEVQETLHSTEQDEKLSFKEVGYGEHHTCALENQREVLIEDIEEGEIISDSPERYHGVDMKEASHKLVEEKASDDVHNENIEKRSVDVPLVESDLLAQKLSVDDSGEKQSVDMKDCNQVDQVLPSLESMSRDCEVDVVGFNKSKDNESSSVRLDEISANAMLTNPSDGSMSFQSFEASSAHVILGVCENTSDNMSTKPSVPSLSAIPKIVESFDVRKGSLNSRDPRRRHETVCLLDRKNLQDMAFSKGGIAEKRKHVQASLLDVPSKRLCLGKESGSMPENQLNDEVLVQESIDMEIDSLDPIAPLPNTADTLDIIYNDEGNNNLQAKPTSSEPFTIINSSKLGWRSRDPRRALVHQSYSDRDVSFTRDTPGSGGVSECKEENPCDLGKRQECLNSHVPGSDKDPWENMHFEELTDQEREAIHVERARRIDEQNHMLNSRKLCLVLDLDHTLLNSAKFSEVDENLKVVLCGMETGGRRSANGQPMKKDLYRYPKLGMWTKLRPGVWDFLSRASELYELHVYTMGNKAYATEMTKLLDPTGTLFAGRVISRGDDSETTFNNDSLPKSKDLDGVLGLESAVIIIDDSIHVWPHHRHNLLVVERYMYFPSSRRQFGLSGPSLLEIRHDERAANGMLASVLKVIEKIHHSFFLNEWLHEVDVRHILMTVKRTVLAGCKIVFSRVYPQGESQPHLHRLWQTAEQFGAVCTATIDDEVTHVVAISRGTDKVKWAMRTGRFSVCPAWLEASAVLYRRASEVEFPVPP